MVLVHDNDLAQLDGIYDDTVSRTLHCPPIKLKFCLQSVESLQPDIFLGHLRSMQLKVHKVTLGPGEPMPVTADTFSPVTRIHVTKLPYLSAEALR